MKARWTLVLVALGLLFAGIRLGGMDAVWRKASVICLECIGLG